MSGIERMKVRPRADAQDARIGEEVRARRLLVGMTQERLGDALGVSFQQVQKYEKGVNRISAGRLRQIAAALGVPVTHFYEAAGGEGTPALAPDGQGLRLVQAHARIADPVVRQRLVDLAEAMAGRAG